MLPTRAATRCSSRRLEQAAGKVPTRKRLLAEEPSEEEEEGDDDDDEGGGEGGCDVSEGWRVGEEATSASKAPRAGGRHTQRGRSAPPSKKHASVSPPSTLLPLLAAAAAATAADLSEPHCATAATATLTRTSSGVTAATVAPPHHGPLMVRMGCKPGWQFTMAGAARPDPASAAAADDEPCAAAAKLQPGPLTPPKPAAAGAAPLQPAGPKLPATSTTADADLVSTPRLCAAAPTP